MFSFLRDAAELFRDFKSPDTCKFFPVVQQSLSCTYIDTKTTQVMEDASF